MRGIDCDSLLPTARPYCRDHSSAVQQAWVNGGVQMQ
jgi:hypothetical protein